MKQIPKSNMINDINNDEVKKNKTKIEINEIDLMTESIKNNMGTHSIVFGEDGELVSIDEVVIKAKEEVNNNNEFLKKLKLKQHKPDTVETLLLDLQSKGKSLRATTILTAARMARDRDKKIPYRYYGLKLLDNALLYLREMRACDEGDKFWKE